MIAFTFLFLKFPFFPPHNQDIYRVWGGGWFMLSRCLWFGRVVNNIWSLCFTPQPQTQPQLPGPCLKKMCLLSWSWKWKSWISGCNKMVGVKAAIWKSIFESILNFKIHRSNTWWHTFFLLFVFLNMTFYVKIVTTFVQQRPLLLHKSKLFSHCFLSLVVLHLNVFVFF